MAGKRINTDIVGSFGSLTSIAGGANTTSGSFSMDMIESLLVGLQVVFGGSPDGNVRVEIFTSPDDSNWDTEAYAQFEIDYGTGETKMKAVPINVDAAYAKVKISNLDSADAITVWGFITQTHQFV